MLMNLFLVSYEETHDEEKEHMERAISSGVEDNTHSNNNNYKNDSGVNTNGDTCGDEDTN